MKLIGFQFDGFLNLAHFLLVGYLFLLISVAVIFRKLWFLNIYTLLKVSIHVRKYCTENEKIRDIHKNEAILK